MRNTGGLERMERILIIEDDELIAELERDYLEANGYETELTFDGVTGENMAKNGKYDAILLDVMLPGKTGYMSRIKKKHESSDYYGHSKKRGY